MSWWSSTGFNNIASQASKALKNAQKQIDKVLDIDETENPDGAGAVKPPEETAKTSWSSDSWSSWSMSWDTGQDKPESKEPAQTSSLSKGTGDKSSPRSTPKEPTQTSSLSQGKGDKLSPRGTPKSSSLKSTTEKTEIVPTSKLSLGRVKSAEKELGTDQASQLTGEAFGLSNKSPQISQEISDNSKTTTGDYIPTSDLSDKMTLNTEDLSSNIESDTSCQVDIIERKSQSNDDVSPQSSSILNEFVPENMCDRLSPLSHGSGETTSSDSRGFEKIDQEKVSEETSAIHSSGSSSDNFCPESKTTISDLMTQELTPSNYNEHRGNVEDMCDPNSIEKNEEDNSEEKNELSSFQENDPNEQKSESQNAEKLEELAASSLCEQDEPLVEQSLTVVKEKVNLDDRSQTQISDSVATQEVSEENITAKEESVDVENEPSESETAEINSKQDGIESENLTSTSVIENVNISPVTSYIRNNLSESHDDQPSSPLATSSSGEGSKLDSSMDTDDTVVEPSAKADSDSMGSVSPSSSYVKCMIEEAMDYNGKMEDNCSDVNSVGKSEGSRSTGGHESGDEIDTTTSSDIEIISTPTSNGDSNKFIDLSPLKIALQKTARRNEGSHRRNDSHDSQSSCSSHSRGDQLSPGRDTDSSEDGVEMNITSEEAKAPLCRELPPLDEEVADPYNTQKLLKKLAEMAEVLQAREDKLLVLSKENADMVETNTILRNQLQQLEETQAVQMEDVDQVTHEFTKRLSESEKLCQQAIREKDMIKKQCEEMQQDFQKRMIKLEAVLKEKEQIAAELMQEGEKLSKQQLQSNTVIKKLRAKEKENESSITGYRKKIEDQTSEIEHLKTCLDSKEEMEKKQTEAISQLNAAVQKQERELTKLKNIETEAAERARGLQAALDNSYKEIAELNKMKAAIDSQAQAEALSHEMHIREELKAALEHEQLTARQEKESLIMQIEDLRISMQRMEKEHNRREDMLKQEISDLQFQLQADEARNQDLSQNVTSATRPLLRQIENLQSTFAQQSASWEKVEKNLSERLYEAQTQLATVTERERSASEKLLEISTQITSLESQNSSLRQDKSQLSAQLEILKSKTQVLEDAKNSESAQLEAYKQQVSRDMAEVRKEKVFLETQLDMEKTKLEQEKKKFILAQDQISQMERDLQRPSSRSSTHSPVSVSRTESISSEPPNLMLNSFTQDDIDKHFLLGPQKTSLYESLRQSGAANLLENLQSQLKLREGEIVQLQSDIQQLERTRESMARELVNLTNQNESLEEKIQELPHIKQEFQDLNQRYNALLQMYGEKVEEADELRLDLNDVKEMYKMQIDHLLAK